MKSTNSYFRPLVLLFMLCVIPLWSYAQSVRVQGIVKDNTGESVIGANVTEKGTTNGTITDLDGRFTLSIGKGTELIVSYVGYTTKTVKIGNQSTIKMYFKYCV